MGDDKDRQTDKESIYTAEVDMDMGSRQKKSHFGKRAKEVRRRKNEKGFVTHRY